MAIWSGAEPFSHDGDEIGVVMCHGFTGSPQGLRPWARALADAGHTVRLPLLPGHGTRWTDLKDTTWDDWYGTVRDSAQELAGRCRTVVVAGLSMGGALALALAADPGTRVDGLLLVNPSVQATDVRLRLLPVIKHLIPSVSGIGSDISKPGSTELAYSRVPTKALHSLVRSWPQVRADLPMVRQPILLFRSAHDHVVPASSSAVILREVSSVDTTEILLPRSFHVATLDHDADRIERESLEFLGRFTAGGESGS